MKNLMKKPNRLTVRLTPEQLAFLVEQAFKTNKSPSAYVRELIDYSKSAHTSS